MKWIYWTNYWEIKLGTKFLTRDAVKRKYKGQYLDNAIWVLSLGSDFCNAYPPKKRNYDAVMLPGINGFRRYSEIMKFRKENPKTLLIAHWNALIPGVREGFDPSDPDKMTPNKYRDYYMNTYKVPLAAVERNNFPKWKDLIEMMDLILIADGSLAYSPKFFNKVFDTDKFAYSSPPLDIKFIEKYYLRPEKKIDQIVGHQQHWVNRWEKKSEIYRTVSVLKELHSLGKKYQMSGIMTKTEKDRDDLKPFSPLGTLWFPSFLERIALSRFGIYNSLGIATFGGLGAIVGTPIVGNEWCQYIVDCFPRLVRPAKDIKGMAKICQRLIDDPGWWTWNIDRGRERVKKFHSLEASKKGLNKLLEKRGLI